MGQGLSNSQLVGEVSSALLPVTALAPGRATMVPSKKLRPHGLSHTGIQPVGSRHLSL